MAEEPSLTAVLFPVGLVGRGFAGAGESRVAWGSFAEHEVVGRV